MLDPLSITAGVVGITTFTMDSLQSLGTYTRDIKKAPSNVRKLISDLDGVESAVSSLNKAFGNKPDSTSPFKKIAADVRLAEMVDNTEASCKIFQASLEKWTKHTTPTHTSKRDRIRIAFETGNRVVQQSAKCLQADLGHSYQYFNSVSFLYTAIQQFSPMLSGIVTAWQ